MDYKEVLNRIQTFDAYQSPKRTMAILLVLLLVLFITGFWSEAVFSIIGFLLGGGYSIIAMFRGKN
jgi:hypothetical protein